MAKTILTVLTLIFTLGTTFAQKNIYVGGEAAVNHDVYEIIDKGLLLKKVPLITGYFGLNIRQELSPNVFLEAGLLRKYYNEGIGFKVFPSYTESNAISGWLIPLRLGTRINIHKQKMHLIPVIGYTLGINSDYGYGNGGIGGAEMNSKDTVYHSGHSKLSLRRTFPLLQTGVGIEFVLLRTGSCSFITSWLPSVKSWVFAS